MAGFGMGGSVSTSSGVGQRAESEARQKEDRYTQQAEAIPTGMGAIPGIAQATAPALGKVVQESNNLNSSDTLSKVLQEASQTGLLSETESTLIGGQIGTPEGNEKARMMLGKTLPTRRADQKAIEFIQGRVGPDIVEIKQIKEPAQRQEAINKLVQKLQLEAAESEDEATRTAIMKRVEDMFGLQSDKATRYMTFEQRMQYLNKKHELKGEYQDDQTGRMAERGETKAGQNLFTKAIGDAKKIAIESASLVNLKEQWDENNLNENGQYELVGFTPKYLSEFGNVVIDSEIKPGTPEYAERMKAKEQQATFMGFLNSYIKSLSGAAVTSQEAQRALRQFGLEDFISGIIPGDAEKINLDDLVKKASLQDNSKFAPQQVINGLNDLVGDMNTRRDLLLKANKASLTDEGLSKLKDTLGYIKVPEFGSAITYNPEDYSAINSKEIGKALKTQTGKAKSGLMNIMTEFVNPSENETTTDNQDGSPTPTQPKTLAQRRTEMAARRKAKLGEGK